MKILFIASEVAPYAKTGGLADVAGALPRALAARGHDVRVVMPRYASVDVQKNGLSTILPEIWVNFPGQHIQGKVYRASHPGATGDGAVSVYFIDCPSLFDREGLYGENGSDYSDNADRFAFFNMAVLWLLKALDWRPDILHCNDWQTAFLPVFLRAQVRFRYDRFFSRTRILFTIHNLAYQGLCDFGLLDRTGLSPALFHAERMEYWGRLCPMKGGIAYSDWISTVSPRYAREILTQEYGCGLDGFLGNRRDRLCGILNGVDTTEWDPATDPLIERNYSADDLAGKAACKAALQESLGWRVDPSVPLLAMINRLDHQKGVDLLLDSLPSLGALGVQIVVLGSGRRDYHERLAAAAKRYPNLLAVRLGFDNARAHAIEAGADALLMLSRFEPCGLNQMFSLKYGTVPIVRETGGLADTVCDATPQRLEEGLANGFTFREHTPEALLGTVERALALYRGQPDAWRRLQEIGMRQELSWSRAAESYEGLYREMLARPSVFVPQPFQA